MFFPPRHAGDVDRRRRDFRSRCWRRSPLMYFNGFTLNVISLAGIALGVGMLVDGSIVVLESIYRRLHEGDRPHRRGDRRQQRGWRWRSPPARWTTVAVFLPVVFISGFAGIFFNQLAITVSFALLCALFVAPHADSGPPAARWLREVPKSRQVTDECVAALGPVDMGLRPDDRVGPRQAGSGDGHGRRAPARILRPGAHHRPRVDARERRGPAQHAGRDARGALRSTRPPER